MAYKVDSELDGIRKTLSEIQRMAGTVAEAEHTRPRQSAELIQLSTLRNKGDVAVGTGSTASSKEPPQQRSVPVATVAGIGAVCGVLVVAATVWLFPEQTTRNGRVESEPIVARASQSAAGSMTAGGAAVKVATATAVTAIAPGSAAAAIGVPPAIEPPAALSPAMPPLAATRVDQSETEPAVHNAVGRTGLTATSLVAMGRIVEARDLLLRSNPEADPDAAWALARTFDPRYVSRMQGADAPPDVAQATHWYRKWHALALAKGRISSDVDVERILRGM